MAPFEYSTFQNKNDSLSIKFWGYKEKYLLEIEMDTYLMFIEVEPYDK